MLVSALRLLAVLALVQLRQDAQQALHAGPLHADAPWLRAMVYQVSVRGVQ